MSHSICSECGSTCAYLVDRCPSCASQMNLSEDEVGHVLHVTRVDSPSVGHEDVPYWVALVDHGDGLRSFRKFDKLVEAGDQVAATSVIGETQQVFGIIGSGVMGFGLAELLLAKGHRVVWIGRDEARLAQGASKVAVRLGRTHDEADVTDAMSRLRLAIGYEALAECDIVIEAVVEEFQSKVAVLTGAESHMRDDAILATNTSGLPIQTLAETLRHPERFGALHFFNPPTRMRLVETAISTLTDEATSSALDEVAVQLGKVPIRVAATPAFAVNRTLMPLLNEAVRILEEGVASAASIDEAVRLGLNHPLGPLALADLIGLDVVVNIMKNLTERTGDETYAPRPMLERLVAKGHLGRKTGSGFHEYTTDAAMRKDGAPS